MESQCYLQPPDTGERPDRPVLDLPTSKGWEAELTVVLVIGLYRAGLSVCKQLDISSSSHLTGSQTHDLVIASPRS